MTRTTLAAGLALVALTACAQRRDTPDRDDMRMDTVRTAAPRDSIVPMPDTVRDTLRNRVDSTGAYR